MRFSDLDDLHAILRHNLFVLPNKVPEENVWNNLNIFSLTSLVIAGDTRIRSLAPYLESVVNMNSPTPYDKTVTSESFSKHYVSLNGNKAILRGSINQGDVRFNLSRSKQCTGVATVACAGITVLDPKKWSRSDFDCIVILGAKYYNDCITARDNITPGKVNLEYLTETDLSLRLIYSGEKLLTTVLEDTNYYGHIDNDNSSDGFFPNLKNTLYSFFR